MRPIEAVLAETKYKCALKNNEKVGSYIKKYYVPGLILSRILQLHSWVKHWYLARRRFP